MPLPWVSRDQYDAVRHSVEARLVDVQAELGLERARADRLEAEVLRLTQQITTMQRQGFAAPLPIADVPKPPALPAAILQAIEARMDPRSLVGRQTTAFARDQLDRGVGAEEIARRILVGQES